MSIIYRVPKLQEDGRSVGIYPKMDRPYRMQCCDCGLVHNFLFKIVKETKQYPDGTFEIEDVNDPALRVEIIVSRNNRATGQVRRRKK